MKRDNDKAFLNACKRLIDKECETNAPLRRRLRKPWSFKKIVTTIFLYTIVVALLCMTPAVMLWNIPAPQPDTLPLYAAFIASYWCLMAIIFRANTAPTLPPAWFYLPIRQADYDLKLRQTFISFPWFYGPSLFFLLCTLAFKTGTLCWQNTLLICGLSLLGAIASWATASWVARRVPPHIRGHFGVGMFFVGLATIIVCGIAFDKNNDALAQWVHRLATHYGESCALLTPGGWTIGIFSANANLLSQDWWYALIPLVGLAASTPLAIRSLMRRFSFETFLAEDWMDNACATDDEDVTTPHRQPHKNIPAPPPSDTVDMEALRQHWAPQCKISRVGWLERRFIRRLSPHEKTTLEHISLQFPRWVLWTLRLIGLGIVFALFLPIIFTHDYTVITTVSGVGLGFTLFFLLIATFPPVTGIKSPAHGKSYPFSLQHFFRIKQKAAIIRALAIAPVYLAIACFIAYTAKASPYHALFIVAQVLLMATLGFPCFPPTFRPSNASPGIRPVPVTFPKSLLRFLIGLGFFATLSALLIASFILPPALATLTTLLFIATARLWKRLFLLQYDRGLYDL